MGARTLGALISFDMKEAGGKDGKNGKNSSTEINVDFFASFIRL